MTLKNKLLSFINDRSGNVAILAAMTTPVLLMAIGAALTLSDATSKKSKLQIHADVMSLSMAKLNNEESKDAAEYYYDDYIETQLDEVAKCTNKIENSPSTATINCSGEASTFLAEFIQKKSVPYSVTSKAIVNSATSFEISFVFDVSDSMRGEEIAELKAGLSLIADSSLFTDKESRISLLPFANTVRLGPEFEGFVTPVTGYAPSGGIYNGCFDRNATDPNVDLKANPTFPLVKSLLNSGKIVCPNEPMTAIFHKKASDWDVKDLISNIEVSFGTGMSDGLVWAFRSLDPNLRGVLSSDSTYPKDSNAESSKHIIMMTDGRPYDRPWTGPSNDTIRAISLARLKDVCEALPFDSKGINFHLINYNNKSLTQEYLDVFKNCVAGVGKFHDVGAGDFEDVLREITEQVAGLRLTE